MNTTMLYVIAGIVVAVTAQMVIGWMNARRAPIRDQCNDWFDEVFKRVRYAENTINVLENLNRRNEKTLEVMDTKIGELTDKFNIFLGEWRGYTQVVKELQERVHEGNRGKDRI